MKDDNLDKDYLPDPPTPINNALPVGKSIILTILEIWAIASLKRTKFIYALTSLYSTSLSSKTLFNYAMSSIDT
jgi:hypothetical protein